MAVETEHVAEVVVVEAELAVGIASGDGIASPVIEGSLAVRDGDRVGGFLEVGDKGHVAFTAVADVAAEPFSFEIGVLQGVGVDAVQTGTKPRGGTRIADRGADEHLEVANVDAAEVRPPDNLALVFGVHVNRRNIALVVILIHGVGETHLLEVGDAGDGLGLFTSLGEGGQQHGGQNRDDGDDDQQLDQGEHHDFFNFVH